MIKMTRKQALILMLIAGKQGDQRSRIRLLIESCVNRAAMNAAWERGGALRTSVVIPEVPHDSH